MPDPTLADVLKQTQVYANELATSRSAPTSTSRGNARSVANAIRGQMERDALQYLLANRDWLERCEQRRLAAPRFDPAQEGALAELRGYVERCVASKTHEELQQAALGLSAIVEEWLLDNAANLDRMVLEQAARLDRGITTHCPVLIVPGSASKPTVGSVEYRGGAPLVIVGADWKPEVQGG